MTVYQGTSFTPERTVTGYALFRAGVKVSAGTCDDLAGSLRRRHERNGTRWRLLDPVAQAVLVIAFLRTNLTYAELAAGFGISPATCWRNVAEGISVLADRGRRISLSDVARLAVKMGWDYLIVDGVHVPTVTFGRKTGGQRAFYSGKHKRHGLNVQTVCSPAGELLWAAAPAPGATVDVTAARKAGIAAHPHLRDRRSLADLGYLGWDEAVITGPAQAAREGADGGAAGREPAAGPAPLRRRARQRPAEILESPGHGAAAAGQSAAPPWSRRSWPCTTWNTTRSPPSAPRNQARSLPGRNTGTASTAVPTGRAKSSRSQRKEPGPELSKRGLPCENPG